MCSISTQDPVQLPKDASTRKFKWTPPSVSAVKTKDPKAISEITGYLERFGDLPKGQDSDQQVSDPALKDALKKLQRIGRIPETGVYDEATAKVMALPRCPVHSQHDNDAVNGTTDSTAPGGARARFTVTGGTWDHTQLTYRFDNVTPDFNGSDAYAAIQKAMSQWSNTTPITFVEVFGAGTPADLVISWASVGFDGPWNVLARSSFPSDHASTWMTFDEAEDWNESFLFQVTLHELGHTLGLNHNDAANPPAVMNSIFQWLDHLQPDDLAGVHSLYGWREPKWEQLDNNGETASIHSASSGIGSSQVADGLYQRHTTGKIWHYVGPPMTGWFMMDDNPNTLQISASGGQVYQLRSDGTVLHYTGDERTASWELIDNSGHAVDILASGWNFYVRRYYSGPLVPIGSSSVWRYTGTPLTGWEEIDSGTLFAGRETAQLAGSTSGQLYQRTSNGAVLQYDTSTSPATWKSLDNNPDTTLIAAGGANLYQMHKDGVIYFYNFTTNGWTPIDSNPVTVEIFAAGNYLYQRHNTGNIWRYTGMPDIWEWLDGNTNTISIIGDDNGSVWQLQRGGLIYRLNS